MSNYTLDQAAQEANALELMLRSPGWALMEAEAKNRLDAAISKLIYAKPEEVAECQAQARAMRFVLEEPKRLLTALVRATETAPEQDA